MATITRKRILVVDDEPAVRMLLFIMLSEADYIVDLAENGKRGLKMLGENSYDLIISDVNMPEMDGMDFYRALIENSPEMKDKMLFVTGGLTDKVVLFFKEHNCEYIAKPYLFEESKLLNRINNLLR